MTTKLTKETEQYIEHEVQLRLHSQLLAQNDDKHQERFSSIDRSIDKLESSIKYLESKFDSQFKWIIGMFVSSIVIPVILHFVKAV